VAERRLHGRLRHGAEDVHEAQREAFEQHIADVCTRSAERVLRERGAEHDAAPRAE
jgi:hypothetical protein